MEMSRKISLSSSSSLSSCSGTGNESGFKTVECHPQTILQMDKSASKSSESCPSLAKIEDDEASNITDDKTAGTAGSVHRNVLVTATAAVRNSANITIVGMASGEKDIATEGSKNASNDSSNKIATSAIESSTSTDDDKGKGNKNEAKGTTNVSDAIADIAASSHFRSRRKKREHTDSPQQNAPPSSKNIPVLTNPPIIVTASMSNHYVPPRLQMGITSQKNHPFSKSKTNDRNSAGSSNVPKNKVSVHMLNSVGLECGDDGTLRLERFDDDDSASLCANDVDSARPIKVEDETGKDAGTVVSKKPSMWTLEQHKAFAAAIFEIGLKNCSPSIIMENMRKQPRYITRERTKSHLQKYRQTKERSKGEFLKEYDAFFKSTEQAKEFLNSKNSSAPDNKKSAGTKKSFKGKEPFPKAVLTTALEGKKPSKLLGGKAAALLSYSVLNGFSTSHGPDQLQYKAAKFSEFPVLTEEEKRSSVGASLLQVKSLIDNMTDVLLKTRHGIKPFPVRKTGIGDDESASSSLCSSDDGSSDEDDDNIDGSGAVDKNMVGKTGSKDQDPNTASSAVPKHGGPFPVGVVPGGPAHPLFRPPPTAYPPPFPPQGAPPPVAAGFPPPQYPPPQPPFYGGAPPPSHVQPAAAPGFGAPPGFHHPQMHYPQDPRINPYQQAPPPQSFPGVPPGAHPGVPPGVPPMQPNYYTPAPGYPPYYGGPNESTMNAAVNNANAEYPPHFDQSRHGGEERQQRTGVYDRQSPSYSNQGRGDRRAYNVSERSTEKRSRRRAEKRSKHRRRRAGRAETPLSVDSTDLQRSGGTDFTEFLDRLHKVPSPSKTAPQKPPSSPIETSRHHGRFKSSPSLDSQDSPMDKPTRKRSRQSEVQKHHPPNLYQPQFDTAVQSNSYTKNYGSPDGHTSEGGGGHSLASTYESSPLDRGPSEQSQSRSHVDQQQHGNNNGQFWDSSNYGEASYNNQQQQQSAVFHQQAAQLDGYDPGSEEHEQQHGLYTKSAQPSPDAGSTANYFFGD